MTRSNCLVLLSVVFAAVLSAGTPARFNVRDFGATADGTQKDTAAIARTIAACVQAGGGVVEFPAGRYLTGTIKLQSNVTLYVGPGATVLGSPDVAERSFRKALESYRPDQAGLAADTRALLARLLLDQGRNASEALALARAAREVRGDRADVVATLARACAATGDPGCAAPAGR